MFSEEQLKRLIENSSSEILNAIKGKIIQANGIDVSGNADISGYIHGGEIVETMNGYSASIASQETFEYEGVYFGIVKNGNKLTIVLALNLTKPTGESERLCELGYLTIPSSIGQKLFSTQVGAYSFLDNKILPILSDFSNYVLCPAFISKDSNTSLRFVLDTTNMVADTKYYVRYEATFLLSENLVPQE